MVELADTGEGVVVLPSGERLLVSGALPGEDVSLVRTGRARADLCAVVAPSPSRVEPPCEHTRRCGGCDLMHLAPVAQRRFHASRLQTALARATGGDCPEPRVTTPGAELAYRSRARLHAVADGRRVHVGYRGSRSHELVAVTRCAVLEPTLHHALEELAELLAQSRGTGDIAVAKGRDGARVYDVHWQGTLADGACGLAHAWVESGRIAGAQLWTEGARAPARHGDPRPRADGADGRELVLAAGGFAQPSDAGGRELARRVAEFASLAGDSNRAAHVLELFAGSGTLSVLLAPLARQLTTVDSDVEASACLRDNLAARGLEARVRTADANEFAVSRDVDLVVLDPPRTGARGAVEAIAASRAAEVIYVACDPATLARDVVVLAGGGFAIAAVESVELFPQTSHAEAVVWLRRS